MIRNIISRIILINYCALILGIFVACLRTNFSSPRHYGNVNGIQIIMCSGQLGRIDISSCLQQLVNLIST